MTKHITRILTATILLIILSVSKTNAQENKNIFIGGDISYITKETNIGGSEYKGDTETNLNLNASIGKFINDKIALGISLGYSYQEKWIQFYDNYDSYDYFKLEFKSISINPFIRTHKDISEKLIIYTEGGFILDLEINEDKTSNEKSNSYRIYGKTGLLYFISSKISLEINLLSLTYSKSEIKNIDHNSKALYIRSGISSPTIGVKWYL
ncbi:MAG: hypothetical protein HRT66_01050 [Flavobacteriaceae bacterium]|nr:hypothetical protein [Flavobacteriaceae bacterium]